MSLTRTLAEVVEESDSPLVRIPDGWNRVELGQVARIINGFAFKSSLFSNSEGVPLLRIRDLFSGRTEVLYRGAYDSRYLVANGDLLVGMDGDFNCTRWTGGSALLNQRVCKIEVDELRLRRDFLALVLPGYLDAIHAATSSTTVTHLSSRDLARLPIPVPALEDQAAFVDAVSRAMHSSDSIVTGLAKAAQLVSSLRVSVLYQACSGALTADWRRARGFDEDPNVDLPSGWLASTIGEQSAALRGGSTTAPTDEPTSWPVLRSSSVRPFQVHYDDVRYLPETERPNDNVLVREGDLLITRLSGSVEYVGNAALVRGLGDRALVFPDRLFRCEPAESIDADYLELAFASPQMRRQIQDASRSAAGHQRISLRDIRSFTIAMPPIDEQREIVRRAQALLATSGQIESAIAGVSSSVGRLVPVATAFALAR